MHDFTSNNIEPRDCHKEVTACLYNNLKISEIKNTDQKFSLSTLLSVAETVVIRTQKCTDADVYQF